MPAVRTASPRARRRVFILGAAIILLVLFLFTGRIIVRIDPLQTADAIFVLGGSRVNRALEAFDLFHEGYATRIVLSNASQELGESLLADRGIHVPTEAEIMRDVLINRLGVPAERVVVIATSVDNTAAEADLIKPLAQQSNWHRLIVITDCATTRRASFAFRRSLGSAVAIIARCSRHDSYNAARWWATRRDLRTTMIEAPKLLAYWFGLKG